jgi:HAD superfamily hydrolase (TIGR01509 family)
MKTGAVIFDLDGVIADSEPLSGRATEMVCRKYGIERTDRERRDSFGRKQRDIFSDVLSARNRHEDIGGMVAEKDRIMESMIRKEGLRPVRGSLEFVASLKGNGLRVALATSSSFEKMDAELKTLGIGGLFEVKVCGDEVSRGKPDPEMFLRAAEKLGVAPSECAVIEDSTFGVQAAKAAGMLSIGFRSPNSPGQDLSAADIVVDDLREAAGHLTAESHFVKTKQRNSLCQKK